MPGLTFLRVVTSVREHWQEEIMSLVIQEEEGRGMGSKLTFGYKKKNKAMLLNDQGHKG